MIKLLAVLVANAAIAGGLVAFPAPAAAQSGNQLEVLVYGNDPCPRSTESQIVVCRHLPESQRYRLPSSQNPQGTRQQRQSWAKKSQQLMSAGNTGTMQCSPVGPGGYTGCLTQEINRAKQDAQEQKEQNTPPL
jgi:hypothetical protein